MPTLVPLQTTRGGKSINARGPTEAEFKSVVRGCINAWTEKGESVEPIFSWDNARIHGNVREDDWASWGITTRTHTLLPPYSPDMHSVIELSHARVMDAMQKFMNDRVGIADDSLPVYTKKVEELFFEVITPAWAQATTHRLFIEVLPAILEAGGDYPPKQLR